MVTDIEHPENATIIKDADLTRIGDFNGDGYDDLLDTYKWVVYFGNEEGAGFETFELKTPTEETFLKHYLDIDGDGKSDIIVAGVRPGKENISLYVLSYTHPDPVYINLDFQMFFEDDKILFNKFDYDNDGVEELFIALYSFLSKRYELGWFVYDTAKDIYDYETTGYVNTNHEPVDIFTIALSDVNGDGLKDICYYYYFSDEGTYLEVYPGQENKPWFGEPFDIKIGTKNRLLTPVGDFDGDGADDWYTKVTVDSVLILYGNPDIAEKGFIRRTFFIDKYHLFYPLHKSYSYYSPPDHPWVFDYNNDGKKDLLFNYWSFDENSRYDVVGMAIVRGNDEPDFTNPLLIGMKAVDCSFHKGFGNKVKNAGDLNNDGFDDWAVVSSSVNEVAIYYGSDPLDFVPDVTIKLSQYPFVKTWDVAFGDLNNDGFRDIVISNSSYWEVLYRELTYEQQRVLVFNGKEEMPEVLYENDADYVINDDGSTPGIVMGASMAIPGDYNTDGFNDLIMKSNESRKALIFYGGTTLSTEPDETITIYSSNYSTSFAIPVTACGDINNDGFNDFVLGDMNNDRGKSWIFFGGPDADINYDMEIDNPSNGHTFGDKIPVTEGDFNNDGYPDLVYGINYNDTILVYFGGPEFDNEPDIFLSDTSYLGSKQAFAFVNNFSEKGKSDLIYSMWYAAEYGYLLMFYGTSENKNSADLVFYNTKGKTYSVASGDFNKDGYVDVFTGHPGADADNGINTGVLQHYVSPFVTGIKDNAANSINTLSVSPNPASGAVTVLYSTGSEQNITILLNNLNGIALKRISGKSNQPKLIDVSGLKKGVYFISVDTGKSLITRKFIKL